MRRVAMCTLSMMLVVAACGDDDGGSSLDLAGAAAGAQRAIDQGDSLGACPWDLDAVVAAVGKAVQLVPEFSDLSLSNGQVYYGGEVDITYCELNTADSTSAAAGISEMRIDVHPGTADLQQYLDEEWGGEVEDASTSKVLGGSATTFCPEEDECLAMWQGDGLFVAVKTYGVGTATKDDATAALKAALPVVVAGLAG